MTIELQNIQRLRVWTESTFATDGTGTLANYTDVPFIEGSLSGTLDRDMLYPETAQQRIDGRANHVLGRKAATLSFSMNLASTGVAGSDGVTQVQSALGEILAAVFGVEELSTGEQVQASPTPTTTAFGVADASVSNITDGSIVGLLTGAGSSLEARMVTESGDTLTSRIAFSAAPSATDDVYAFATYSLASNPSTTLQFIVEGAEQDDRWLVLGVQLESMTLDFPLNQLPRVTFSFKAADWMHGDDTASVLTGSAIGTASYTYTSPMRVDGELLIQDHGTTTRPDPTCASAVSVTINLSYADVPCPSGTNGISRWRRIRNGAAANVSVTTLYESEAWFDKRDALTAQQMLFQLGTSPGSCFVFDAPNMQILNVQRAPSGDLAGQTIDFETRPDAHGGATADQALSAFRFAFG